MGIAMVVVGGLLHANAERLAPYAYLLAPLPPICVAAYVYAVLQFRPLIDGDLSPSAVTTTIKQLFAQFLVGGVAFLVISGLMLGVVLLWRLLAR